MNPITAATVPFLRLRRCILAAIMRDRLPTLDYAQPRPKRSILRPASWFTITMAILMALLVALVRWANMPN